MAGSGDSRTAPAATVPAPATLRGELWVLAAILAAALLLRWLHWARTPAMFNDGPRFLGQAERFYDGRFAEGLADVYHPLYALVTAGVQALLGPADPAPDAWENVAAGVSIVAGAGGVVAFYFFLREAFDRGVAWVGASLLAVQAYTVEFASDVQSDGLYHVLFLAAVALGWTALRTARPSRAALTGAAAGLAYLTRPEGLGVAVVVGLLGVVQVLRRRWRPLPGLAWGAALAAGALLLVAPYLAFQFDASGQWTLTRKKSVAALAGVGEVKEVRPGTRPEPGAQVAFSPEMRRAMELWEGRKHEEFERKGQLPGPWERRAWAVGEVLHTTVSALRPELVLFVVVGVLAVGWPPGRRGGYLICLLVLYAAAVLGLAANYGYVSRRHVLPPATLLLGYAAVAVPLAGRLLARAGGRLVGARDRASPALAVGLGLVMLVAFALGKQLRPVSPESLAERRAAEWVRAKMNPAGPVAADRRRVAYYAGAQWFPLREVPVGGPMAELLRSNGVRIVIADETDLERHAALADPEDLGSRVVYRVEANGGRAAVYDLGASEGD